jgi:hypothetical protein
MSDTIKPEVGKTYLTRDGRKARCICTDRRDDRFPVLCLMDTPVSEVIETYTEAGRFNCGQSESPLDLVSEAPRVVTVNVWVELTPGGRVLTIDTFAFSPISPTGTLIKITQDVELSNV